MSQKVERYETAYPDLHISNNRSKISSRHFTWNGTELVETPQKI